MPVTMLLNDRTLAFDADGRLIETRRYLYRIERADQLGNWATTGARYEPWHQDKPRLSTRVISPSGAVAVLDEKTIADSPAYQSSNELFSDVRQLNAPIPALTQGSIVQEEVVVTDTQPRFSAGIVRTVSFWHRVPCQRVRLTVIHPVTLPLNYKVLALPGVKIAKSTSEGVETIIFDQGPLPAVDTDDDHAPDGEPIHAQVSIATGPSWHAVASAYAKATEPKIRLEDVASLVTQANRRLPREARIVSLITKLHKEVRYTGIEFGQNALIPQFPAETLGHHYGDCKDKATLLVAMLRSAGIAAKLALLNAASDQAVHELPGMAFDHAIVFVPGSGKQRDYWIDATSSFSPLGTLPYADYGRNALIVDESTTQLTKIPVLRAEDNIHVEERRFDLAEDGPATVVEIDWNKGPWDASSRSYAFSRTKDTAETYKKYIRGAYLSDELAKLDFDDPTDLTRQFKVTMQAAKARRGSTDFEGGVAAILPFDVTDGLPNDLRYERNKKDAQKPRVADYEFYPFIAEWRYEIHPPMGYSVRSLPPNLDRAIASAHLTETFESLKDGTVKAVIRFDSGKGRLTPHEAEQMRVALAELRNSPAIMVGFESDALALINAGKVKEGLARYESMSLAHPKEALHRMQKAAALVNLGLGERARTVAKQAVQLEPENAKAHNILGQILEFDLIGRRYARGFDYAGAVAALNKAKSLDPTDKDVRIRYAMLLEYGPGGEQYTGARLEDALNEWAELKQMDEDYVREYENNVLFDLYHLDRHAELQQRIATLQPDNARRQLLLASMALQDSPQAAIERAKSMITDRSSRGQLLTGVGAQLLKRRKYSAAAAIYRAAASESDSAAGLLNLAEVLEHTKVLQNTSASTADVTGALIHHTVLSSDPELTVASFKKQFSKTLATVLSPKHLEFRLRQEINSARAAGNSSGMSTPLLLDIGFGAATFTTDGDEHMGYRITMKSQNTAATSSFFVKEDGQWKYVSDAKSPQFLAGIVLDALEQHDFAKARRWLDWAREATPAAGSLEDPLSGELFARFWTKGQKTDDEGTLRRAAIALAHETEYAKAAAPSMSKLFGSPSAADQMKFLLIRAAVARRSHRWQELHDLGSELLKAYPESKVAAGFVADAALQLKNYDEAEAVYKPFLERDAHDRWVLLNLAEVQSHRGDYDAAQKVLLPLVQDGTANTQDLNGFAWYSLFSRAGVDKVSLDAGERGTQLEKDSYPVLHTVASQYAEIGRGKEAYNLILKAMEAASLSEPESSIWYTLGRIAESYGEYDAALAMYKKVEINDEEVYQPTDTYYLAQRHTETVNALLKPSLDSAAQSNAR
jgi:tetratricopeptide (TPR) repeat protein